MTEPEEVEGLVCDTSVSEFDSRQSPQIKLIRTQLLNEAMQVSGSKNTQDYACSMSVFRFSRPELVQSIVVHVD